MKEPCLFRQKYVLLHPTKSHWNRLVALRREFFQYANWGRIRKSEGFQIVTSKIALFLKLLANTESLRISSKVTKKKVRDAPSWTAMSWRSASLFLLSFGRVGVFFWLLVDSHNSEYPISEKMFNPIRSLVLIVFWFFRRADVACPFSE